MIAWTCSNNRPGPLSLISFLGLSLASAFLLPSEIIGLSRTTSVGRSRAFIMGSAGDSSSESSPQPELTFGVIADIQYAPIPDGFSYGGVPRYYQHAKDAAAHAANHFEEEKVPLAINLGDIIDGKCQEIAKHGGTPMDEGIDVGMECTDHVLEALSSYTCGKLLHTYGNHELYNLNRQQIGEKLSIPFVQEQQQSGDGSGASVGYFSHTVTTNSNKKIKFVVIDSYGITLLGHPPASPKRTKAEAIMSKNNPNYPQLENSPEGLEDFQKRFVGFNGAVDEPQLAWLHDTLAEARDNKEQCIIVSHQPILPGTCSTVTLIWNYEQVLDILREFKDVVVLSLAGHAHKGGYKCDDKSGIHFRVLEAALETPAPGMTYAFVDVYPNRIVVRGHGDCESAEYNLSSLPATRDADEVTELANQGSLATS